MWRVTQSCWLASTLSNVAEPRAGQVLWGLLFTKPLGPLSVHLSLGIAPRFPVPWLRFLPRLHGTASVISLVTCLAPIPAARLEFLSQVDLSSVS